MRATVAEAARVGETARAKHRSGRCQARLPSSCARCRLSQCSTPPANRGCGGVDGLLARARRPTRGTERSDAFSRRRGKLGKTRKQATSAPTLAAVWCGPVELTGALRRQPQFEGSRLTRLAVEAESS